MRGLLALALAPLCLEGCGDFRALSRWRGQAIQVDGWDDDWIGVDESKFSGLTLKAVNDADALYVCLSVDSAYLRRQLTGPRPWTLSLRPGRAAKGDWGLRFEHVSRRSVQVIAMGPDPSVPGHLLDPESDGLDFVEHESSGRLVMEFKFPLRAETEKTLVLGCGPGGDLKLGLTLPQGAFGGPRDGGPGAGAGGPGRGFGGGPPAGGGFGGGPPGGGFGGGPPSGGAFGGGPPGGGAPRMDGPGPEGDSASERGREDAILWGTLRLASAP